MINIKDKWFIDADQHCYTVNKRRMTAKGFEYSAVSYHPTLAQCLKSIMIREQREAVENDDMTLPEAISKIRELNIDFERILHEVRKNERLTQGD